MKVSEARLLRKIERGFAHSLPAGKLGPREARTAQALITRGWIARCAPRGRWPDRYVTTSRGSHVLGTFEFDRF